MSSEQFKVVFVLGAPGAGKGTVCQRVQEHCGYHHISAGEMLRQEMKKENSVWKATIEEYVGVCALVPGDITVKLLLQWMEEGGSSQYVIDGFPRALDLLDHWAREIGDRAVIQKVIALECSQEVCTERCLSRGPACGRTDDTSEKLAKRFDHFRQHTTLVYDYFRERNLLEEIDAERTPDQVFEAVRDVFENL